MDESSIISSLHKENIIPNLSLLSETLKSSLPSSVKTKRGQWYSPCSSPRPKQPNSPDDYLPILKLTHFEKTPRVLFNSVKLGSSKTEELVIWNPNHVPQTLRVEKCPSKAGFSVELSGFRENDLGSSVLTIEADEEIVLPVRWEPTESGKYREMMIFKWNETHRLQTILIGTAVDLKTKKKKPSVLGLSQSLNTVQVKRSFKRPKFSVVTKDVKQRQEKPVCNLEFGKKLPEVKEDILEDSTDERRETYVVKSAPILGIASTHKEPENLRRERKDVDVNNSKSDKENNQQKDPQNMAKSVPSASVLTSYKEHELLQTEKKCADVNELKNEKECKDRKKQKDARAKWKTNTDKEQVFKEFKVQTSQLDDNKLVDKQEKKAPVKPKISASTAKRTVELVKNKVDSGVTKEDKVIAKPVAFSIEPTIKKEKPKPKNHQKKTSLQRAKGSSPLKKTRKVKLKVASRGVAPTKLKLVRPPKTSIPRHPMPFAAKNMYYDERWIDKQEEGFTRWLNFILTPPDDCEITSKNNNKKDQSTMLLTGTKSMESSRQPKAPSKEELSIKAYTARRKMSRLRRLACLLYQSEPVICVLRKIEAEVEVGRMAIRPDKKMHADLGIKNNVVEMILSYNPLWLRIGLETTYGEIMPVQTNSDVQGLARFVSDRLLGNPDIARTYAHPSVPGLYRDGYVEQLAKFTLKKFLFLVLFLDRAKLTRLIDHDPCLFVKNAEYKSSRSLLLAFSREYLKGEGDITKHLSYLGFSVTHEQRPIDEFDYAVTNIATDLRDGLRLTRVVELLTHNWQLTQSLRVPAISRLQKIHNVEVFMKALRDRIVPVGEGTDSGINPRHIVDGHREKTLQLLWLIIFNFQVNILLNEKQLQEEISFLEHNQDLQNRLETMTVDGSKILGLPRSKRESLENNVYFRSPRLSLLLKWCRNVCKLYGMKIENFTVSFSDGRALCYLLHYYHPNLLPLDLIRQETTLTRNPGVHDNSDSEEEEGIITDSWVGSYSPGSGRNTEIEKLKENEKQNFKLLAEKVQALGGIPLMAKFADMSNTIPDEKVVITYTSYLCARLLDLREETRAARTIQVAWKKYLLRKELKRRRVLSNAVAVVQACAKGAIVRRRFIKLKKAAVIIQSTYRGYSTRHQIHLQHKAARTIQAKFRATRNMCRERADFIRYRNAVVSMQALIRVQKCKKMAKKIRASVKIQAMWRCHKDRARYLQIRKATIVCQKLSKGARQKKSYLRLRCSTLVIQNHFRAFKSGSEERRRFQCTRNAVITIQAFYRGYRTRVQVQETQAAIAIQKNFRMLQQRSVYLKQREAVIKIQTVVRKYLAQKSYTELKTATQSIQSRYRAYKSGREQRESYKKMRSCCVKIQALQRGYLARKRFLLLKNSTIKIQAALRKVVAQSHYRKLRHSAVIIQQHYRSYLLMKQVRSAYIRQKSAAIVIQAFYRRHQCRKSFLKTKTAAVEIEACFRGYIERKKFLKLKNSAIVLQRRYLAARKGRQERLMYHIQRGAMITIQAAVRGFLVRQSIKRQHSAATIIQAIYKCYAQKTRYSRMKKACFILQTHYRAFRIGKAERSRYQNIRASVLVIQAYFRGMAVRKDIRMKHKAATIVQSYFRCYVHKSRYSTLKQATEVIQRRFRASQEGNAQRQRYGMVRSSTIVIQSAFRGYRVRRMICIQTRAAVIIQAAYRSYVQRSAYLSIRSASIAIQCWYRASQMRKIEEQNYKTTKAAVLSLQAVFRGYKARKLYKRLKAVVCLQSALRGHLARREVRRMNQAAVDIQAYYRGFSARKKYQAIKQAVVTIQMSYRAFKLGQEEANKYRALKNAAVTIQSVFRGCQARREFRRIKSAVRIQSAYRGHLARKEYSSTRKAIICIQAAARCFLAARYYRKLRRVTIFLQQKHRANMLLLKEYMCYHIQRGACIVIQSAVRSYFARTKFLAIKAAALTIQRRHKAIRLGKEQKEKYKKLRTAARTIQAFARVMIARKHAGRCRAARKIQAFYRMHASRKLYQGYRNKVIKLQSLVRMIQERRRYRALKASALTIQLRYRAVLLGRAVQRNYEILHSATVVIQKSYRGYKARKEVERIRAAVRIQATYKSYVCRKEFLKVRRSVVMIQANVRKMIAVRQFQEIRQAVVTLQTRYRAQKSMKEERSKYIITRNSATLIQAMVRGLQARNRYIVLRKATLCLQRNYRSNVAAKEQREEYLRLKDAAIVMQSVFRGFKARQLAAKMRAARTIQSYYKMYVVRRDFLVNRKAVIKIQAYIRMRKAFVEFATLKSATLTCQARFRANKQCRDQRRYYATLREKVVLLQSLRRGMAARKQVNQMKRERKEANEAATKIQRYYRGYIEMRYFYLRFHYTRGAIITIQSVYRGHVARRHAHRVKVARKIQAFYRGLVARRSYHLARESIINAQALVRCHQARASYLKLKNATVVCQNRYRATLKMHEDQQSYHQTKTAITKIQAHWRGHRMRERYHKTIKSIVTIQSVAKMYLARIEYKRIRQSVMVLQRRYRALCQGRAVRRDYGHIKNAALTIQSFYRGYQARRYVQKIRSVQILQRRFRAHRQGKAVRHQYIITKRSAVVIQAAYRGYQGRKEARLQKAARIIQVNVRGYIARKKVKQLKEEQRRRLLRFSAAAHYHLSAIRIQRAFKQARAIALAKKQINSVLYIQCWWRATLIRRRFVATRKAAIVIQRTARRRLELKNRAATRIQAIARVWLARRAVDKMNSAALSIQALWRGYQVRCRVSGLKIKTARRRIKAANERATDSMKLCNRTRSALDYLLRCKNLTTIFDILVNLEVVTRLSYVCCEQLVKDKALKVIFTVIRSSNRSLPYMEILKYALAILINLVKCPTTYRAVYEEQDSITTLLELITIYREKEQIFSKTCCLLTILGRRDENILQEMLDTPKMTDKIKSAHYLITRKSNLQKRRSVIKAKMARSTPYKNVPASTPCKQTPFKSSHTPFKARKKSEYAMWQEYVNKVQDPLQALRSLMRVLRVDHEEPNVN